LKHVTSRFIQIGGTTYSYDPEGLGDNVIAIGRESPFEPSWLVLNHMFDGQAVARYLRNPGQQGIVRLLPRRVVAGRVVNPIQVSGGASRPGLRMTLYFDAGTSVLRGFDASGIDPSYKSAAWKARLSTMTFRPAASAPPGTFELNAPANASILLPTPDLPALGKAFQAICHSRLNLKQVVGGAGSAPLQVCSRTNPHVTESALVSALMAPVERDFANARHERQISAYQLRAAIVDLRSEMTRLVTGAKQLNAISLAPSGK
jgi:hypothetical protein